MYFWLYLHFIQRHVQINDVLLVTLQFFLKLIPLLKQPFIFNLHLLKRALRFLSNFLQLNTFIIQNSSLLNLIVD